MIKKIIITDDSKDFRKALKVLLKEIYHSELKEIGSVEIIDEAENGAELLEKIKKNEPELIFMDIEMPYINGYEATKKIVSQYPNIKIVGMSSYNKENYIQFYSYVKFWREKPRKGWYGRLIIDGTNPDPYELLEKMLQDALKRIPFKTQNNDNKRTISGNS